MFYYRHKLHDSTEEQLRALSTQRLNAYRKYLLQASPHADPSDEGYDPLEDASSEEYKARRAFVKGILDTREHIPSKREKQASQKKRNKKKLRYRR